MAKKRVTKKTNGKSGSRGNTVKIVVEQKGKKQPKRRARFGGVFLKIAAVAIVALLAVWGLSKLGVFDKLPSNGCAGIEIPGLKGCANKKTNPNKDDPNADSGVTDPDEDQKDDASNGVVTITFNANGGTLTGAATMKTGKDGKLAELPSEPTREGYTFVGWTLSKYDVLTANGERQGVIYEETVFLKNQTVYAYWADPIKVTFEPVVTASGTLFDGTVVNLIGTDTFNVESYKDLWPEDPTREGYTFNGWADTVGTFYTVESTFADDTTLRAKFSRLPGAYEITFNANGGTLTGAYKIMTGDDGIVADWPADPTHETLYFHGWSVNKDGDGGIVSSSTVFDVDTVLYAVWGEEPPEQIPDEGGNEGTGGESGGGNEGGDNTGAGGNEGGDNTGTGGDDNTGTGAGGEGKPDDGTGEGGNTGEGGDNTGTGGNEGDDNTGTGGDDNTGTGAGGEGKPDDGTGEGGDNTGTGGNEGDDNTGEGGDNTGTGGNEGDDNTDEGGDNTGTGGNEGGDNTGTGGNEGDDNTDEGGENTGTGGNEGDDNTDEGDDNTGTGGNGSAVTGREPTVPNDESFLVEFDKSESIYGAEVSISLPEQMMVLPETVGISAGYMGYDSVSIDDVAFRERTGMKYLYLDYDVVAVGYDAFAGCSDLEEVTIMNPDIIIREYAFAGCVKLNAIFFNGTWADIVELFESGAWNFNSFAATPNDCIIYFMQATGAENDPQAVSILSIRNDGYLVEYTPETETETEGSESNE